LETPGQARLILVNSDGCGVWIWSEKNLKAVEDARRNFDEKAKAIRPRTFVFEIPAALALLVSATTA